MVVLLTCKKEEDSIEIEGARVLKRLNINFSATQGQLTPQSVVESKFSCLPLFPARIKIKSKMKALKW